MRLEPRSGLSHRLILCKLAILSSGGMWAYAQEGNPPPLRLHLARIAVSRQPNLENLNLFIWMLKAFQVSSRVLSQLNVRMLDQH